MQDFQVNSSAVKVGGRPAIPAETKAAFLSAMANTPAGGKPFATALAACRVKKSTVYNWRRDPSFEFEFQLALRAHAGEISDVIFEEAVVGTPIFSDSGAVIGYRRNTVLLKALGEAVGLLPSSRPAVAVAIQTNAPAPAVTNTPEDVRQRIRAALQGRVIDSTATEVPADPAQQCELPVAAGEARPDDGSDLI